ncbi:MAG TPA: type II toxin-antitoxin system RelE/ParE family toxin [Acetobacteraceae bacterium]|nr:type II toxin-antitoxin system RelE/ParE family toxin [Acetobacteraceae bacterium]
MVHRRAPEADKDLDEIWYHIAKESNSVSLADRVVDRITDRLLLLALHPRLGRRRDELRAGLRSFPVRPYLIIYRIANGDVLILRVLHGRRDIDSILSEDDKPIR